MCYFHDYASKLLYHHLPVLLLLSSNLTFFLLTVHALFCGVWAAGETGVQRPPSQSLHIVVGLVFLTGAGGEAGTGEGEREGEGDEDGEGDLEGKRRNRGK